MKKLLLSFICLFSCWSLASAEEITGYWVSVNDVTQKPECLVSVYEHEDQYYGRIILTYNQDGSVNDTIYDAKERAPGIKGDPSYAGMDILYHLVKEEAKPRYKGKIVDPEKGRVYDAEVWLENGNLIVRGEILFFGRSEVWPPATESSFPADFKKPDTAAFIPVIPHIK